MLHREGFNLGGGRIETTNLEKGQKRGSTRLESIVSDNGDDGVEVTCSNKSSPLIGYTPSPHSIFGSPPPQWSPLTANKLHRVLLCSPFPLKGKHKIKKQEYNDQFVSPARLTRCWLTVVVKTIWTQNFEWQRQNAHNLHGITKIAHISVPRT